LTCPHCAGGGKSLCSKCEGKGKIVCSSCLGRKKILAGQAFHSAFKPFQAQSAGLVVTGPPEALDMAMKKTIEVGSLNLSTDESFETQVRDAVVPVSLRAALSQLGDRVKPLVSATTHAVKHRLDMAEGSVVRISGYCSSFVAARVGFFFGFSSTFFFFSGAVIVKRLAFPAGTSESSIVTCDIRLKIEVARP
jgi:DnaJ-class molecular chaperone